MRLIRLFILMFMLLFIASCSDENNPIGPVQSNQFIGAIGTNRTYTETERWLEAGTNKPFFTVPEKYKYMVSLIDYQLENGVSIIKNYSETVNPIDDDFYLSWELPFTKVNYIQCSSLGRIYRLSDELRALEKDGNYSLSVYETGPDIYQLSDEGILSIMPMNMQKQFPPQPFIKGNISVNDSWIREKYVDTLSGNTIIETVAKVISKEKVNVPAGVFNAFKIKLTTNHFDPDYSFEAGYEYYVPNIGLVLKESDMVVSQWNSINNETITFRQIIRKELIAYDFVSE